MWYRSIVYANRVIAEYRVTDLLNIMSLEYTQSKTVFTLDAGSAQCAVNPQGPEVIYFEGRTWCKDDHRYRKESLPAGMPLYLIGNLDTR